MSDSSGEGFIKMAPKSAKHILQQKKCCGREYFAILGDFLNHKQIFAYFQNMKLPNFYINLKPLFGQS